MARPRAPITETQRRHAEMFIRGMSAAKIAKEENLPYTTTKEKTDFKNHITRAVYKLTGTTGRKARKLNQEYEII
jgi:hypothetical protein